MLVKKEKPEHAKVVAWIELSEVGYGRTSIRRRYRRRRRCRRGTRSCAPWHGRLAACSGGSVRRPRGHSGVPRVPNVPLVSIVSRVHRVLRASHDATVTAGADMGTGHAAAFSRHTGRGVRAREGMLSRHPRTSAERLGNVARQVYGLATCRKASAAAGSNRAAASDNAATADADASDASGAATASDAAAASSSEAAAAYKAAAAAGSDSGGTSANRRNIPVDFEEAHLRTRWPKTIVEAKSFQSIGCKQETFSAR